MPATRTLVDRHGRPISSAPPKRYKPWRFIRPMLIFLGHRTACRWYYSYPFTFRCEHGCLLKPYALLTKGAYHMGDQAVAWHVKRFAHTLAVVQRKLARVELV